MGSQVLYIKRFRDLKSKGKLSKILQAEVTKQDLRHKDVAEMTGIAQSTVSRCLSGDMPISKEHAELMSDALGLDKEWIVTLALGEKEVAEIIERYSDYPSIIEHFKNIKLKIGVA